VGTAGRLPDSSHKKRKIRETFSEQACKALGGRFDRHVFFLAKGGPIRQGMLEIHVISTRCAAITIWKGLNEHSTVIWRKEKSRRKRGF
jgi:hypothetical protein